MTRNNPTVRYRDFVTAQSPSLAFSLFLNADAVNRDNYEIDEESRYRGGRPRRGRSTRSVPLAFVKSNVIAYRKIIGGNLLPPA